MTSPSDSVGGDSVFLYLSSPTFSSLVYVVFRKRHMEKGSKWMKIWNGADKRNIQNKATNKTNLYSSQNMHWYIKNIANSTLLVK